MWLFTRYGFFSATRSRMEPDKIQIRARSRADLERLLEFVKNIPADLVQASRIIETPNADYRWRIVLPAQNLAVIMGALADDVDYFNFKDQIKDNWRHTLYLRVWSLMLQIQQRDQSPPPGQTSFLG